jgi:hypothetical protein
MRRLIPDVIIVAWAIGLALALGGLPGPGCRRPGRQHRHRQRVRRDRGLRSAGGQPWQITGQGADRYVGGPSGVTVTPAGDVVIGDCLRLRRIAG